MASPGKHIIGYLPATIVPAVLSFVTVYTFTRLLSPTEYGAYSLALTGVLLGQAACFYALQLGVARFYPAAERDGTTEAFLKMAYRIFVVIGLPVSVAVLISLPLLGFTAALRTVALIAIPVYLFRSLVSLNQSVNRAARRVVRYNWVECSHAVLGFLVGVLLVALVSPTAQNVLLGLLAGAAFAALIDRRSWQAIASPVKFDRAVLSSLLRFSGPLALSYATAQLLQNSDRFLIGTFNGTAAAGIYAVAINLVDRPITLICTSITTATFPFAVHAMEREGEAAAGDQVARSGAILVSLTVPACVGLAMASGPLSAVLVGPEFRESVARLVPIVSAAALLRGISVHFLEHAFHISRRSDHLLAINLVITVVSMSLNSLLLPRFGVTAAAWVAVGCQSLLAMADFKVGRLNFRFVFPTGEVLKVLAATAVMALVLSRIDFALSWAGLGEAVALGVFSYAAAALVLDLGGARRLLLARV